jgi:DNA-binding response OmpR family regulator
MLRMASKEDQKLLPFSALREFVQRRSCSRKKKALTLSPKELNLFETV